MRTAALGELCEITVGRTPARADASFWGAGEPWLSIADMNQGHFITTTKEQVTTAGARAGKQAQPGTVLLSFKLSIGKVAIAGMPLYTNEAIAALPIRDKSQLEEGYLLRALEATDFAGKSNRAAMGATLNKASLQSIQVPIPPLDEQRRIAAILDQADAIRAKRRQVLAHLDALAQAIFDRMFADARASLTLSDIANVQGGLQVTHTRAKLPIAAPYLRVANVMRGRLDLAEIKTLQVSAPELERTRLRRGDLLFVEGHGNPNEVGRAALWDGSIDICTHQNHLIRARLDEGRCLPEFAATWVNTRRGAAYFRRCGRTTSGLNTISAATVRSAPMLEVPLAAQHEFVRRTTQLDAQSFSVLRALAADDELFASLQSRAFRGEL